MPDVGLLPLLIFATTALGSLAVGQITLILRILPSLQSKLKSWERLLSKELRDEISAYSRTGDVEHVVDVAVQFAIVTGFHDRLRRSHGHAFKFLPAYVFTGIFFWYLYYGWDSFGPTLQSLGIVAIELVLFLPAYCSFVFIINFYRTHRRIMFKETQ